MKHIIFAILFLVASVGISAVPHDAWAKRAHIVRHVRARRVVYRRRTVYVGSRSHGVNTNANVGVGVGPIHVGVGAGGGIQLHEALPPQHVIPDDPPSDPSTSMIPVPITRPEISSTGVVVAHPSDCDLECYNTSAYNTTAAPTAAAAFIDTANVVTITSSPVMAVGTISAPKNENERLMSGNSESFTEPYVPVIVRYAQQQFALSPNVNSNDYYATHTQPKVVTVGGFDVRVNSNTSYYSPFKSGRDGFWYVHNQKGEDVTAGYGVSPRAGSIPESIGGSAYSVVAVDQ